MSAGHPAERYLQNEWQKGRFNLFKSIRSLMVRHNLSQKEAGRIVAKKAEEFSKQRREERQ